MTVVIDSHCSKMASTLKFTGLNRSIYTIVHFPSFLIGVFASVSAIDPSFWHGLTEEKLERLKLDERPLEVVASYAFGSSLNLPARLSLGNESFGRYVTRSNVCAAFCNQCWQQNIGACKQRQHAGKV